MEMNNTTMPFEFQGGSLDEREAASIVAGLHTNNTVVGVSAAAGTKKRSRDNGTATVANKKRLKKKPSTSSAVAARSKDTKAKKKDPPMDATGLVFAQPDLKPSPYFYYTDHSLEQDDDPLTPMTAAGSVPTFPAKMHAILTNPQLADVVGWAPHGRSWRILKPRDFEIRVLPKYFEHSKFSSFVRQANGWGFRRMSHGDDKNAYYHEYFLRAMPWLCKKMRRPKVSEKKAVDPDMEPDLDAISAQLPVLDAPPTREVLVLQKTIELGPKARMPVMWDTGTPPATPTPPATVPQAPSTRVGNLPSLGRVLSYGDLKPAALPNRPSMAAAPLGTDTVHMLNMGNNVQNMMHRGLSYGDLNLAALPIPPSTAAATAPQGAGTIPTATVLNMGNNVQNMMPHGPSYGDLNRAALHNPPSMTAAAPQGAGTVPTVTMLNMGNDVQNMMPHGLSYGDPKPAAVPAPMLNMQNIVNNSLPQNATPAPSNPNNFNTSFNYPATYAVPPSSITHNQTNASDSHFAAGFMAASAYHSNHIRNMLNNAFVAGMPIPDNGNVVMPSKTTATTVDFLQRVAMGQSNLQPQGNPDVAAASSVGVGGIPNRNGGGSSSSTLSEQAMQRLQQFQAFSSQFE
mmetsp:Transcript_30206/g.55639  ORF Transcript_30206/g.55639 Transcript_30206/m.55639 type:complete len:626 (+) Transcript_30206:65-1942(+)